MMKERLTPAVVLSLAALVGTLACSSEKNPPPAAAPLNCERGTHQQGDKCVLNAPVPVPAPTTTPTAR
jgi:hypothetical protein